MNNNGSELTVITKAKDLCSYVVKITQESPKQYRFTFVTRLQNLAIDVIENLYRANDTFVTKDRVESGAVRLDYQHKALTDLRLLAYFSLLAFENGCILVWITSERRRLSP